MVYLLGYFDSKMLLFITKVNIFRGDLTNISANTKKNHTSSHSVRSQDTNADVDAFVS